MALESGGYAEKIGNRYEANWVAYLLLQLLNERVVSVTVEPIGDDESGVDVIVEHSDGKKEYHQCKSSNSNNEHWTLSQLNSSNILANALFQIQRGTDEFHLVSPLGSKNLTDLCNSALNSTENVSDFYEYQVKTSATREKLYQDLCGFLGLDCSISSDQEEVLLFLKKFKVTQYMLDMHTAIELEDKSTALFSDEPSKVLHFLKNYPVEFNKLRVKITAPSLFKDLEKNGFLARVKVEDKRLTPIIERTSEYFSDSIKPFLISDTIIPRPELNEIIASLDSHAITILKAEAGMGKSALLLELHEAILAEGSISLPIRLDRNRPENNADDFGRKLGFPYSPILCVSQIAPEQKKVIILDQLDAVRWTTSHSSNALQVCKEMVRQVLALKKEGHDISIILASRNFDLDEDVALSGWIKDLDKDVSDVSLSQLDAETVSDLIKPFESFALLPEEKKRILSIPLWLSIYLTIAEKGAAAPLFLNKLELVKRYWDDRIKKVNTLGVDENTASQFIDEIVVLMNSKTRLSVPENILSSPKTLEAMLSVGILTKQAQQISFRHQALFDYQIGIKLFTAAQDSPEKLIAEIGDFSHQTLTKREHLKYALNMLLDFDQAVFCNTSIALLVSNDIRFHIKYLVFNSLKELNSLKAPARLMIDTIVSSPELLQNFITNSCYGNYHIINYLSECGILSTWLNSENPDLIDKAVYLLRSIPEISPNTVIKELKPFINKSEEWNQRVYSGLCWNIENDSDEIFEIRKELIKLGCNAGFIHWSKLAKKKPVNALDLIEMLLHHYKEALCNEDYSAIRDINSLTHRDAWSSTDLDELCDISLKIPEEVISRLLAIINDFMGNEDKKSVTFNWFYKDRYSFHDAEKSITHGVFKILGSACKQLSETKPETLVRLLTPYLKSESVVLTHLLARFLLNLPTDYSDMVIEWLLDNSKLRLSCGNKYIEPVWILSGKLVEKFSVECSNSLFDQLEERICFSSSIDDIEHIKWRLEATRTGSFYSIWGDIQYFLLPKLPPSRIKKNTKQLIGVLNRKFNSYTDDDFCLKNNIRGGTVTSPLPSANVLSDRAWRNLILAPKEQVNKGTWIQQGKESVAESSIEQFGRSLDSAVKNQPIRFARLALSLPSNIDQKYIEAIYSGLAETDKKNINEKYQDEWKVCPVKLTENIINHFKDTDCEYSLVRLLERRITEKNWSKESKLLLIDLAINAKDPKLNKLNIMCNVIADDADSHTLRGNAINCCRGIAYEGISHLFWEDEEFTTDHKELIQSAIDDPHPAVNMATLDMLVPMLNHDEAYAERMFLTLCEKDQRMACGYGAHYFFNRGFEGKYKEEYINLVLKMLESPLDEVKKEAAKQVFARWVFSDLFSNRIDSIINGELIFRKGVANVLSQFLTEDKFHENSDKLLIAYEKLVNDEDEEILKKVGQCVSSNNYWEKPTSKDYFDVFVISKAATHCLYELFEGVEKYSGSLLSHQEQLLKLVENITSSNNTGESIRNMHLTDTSFINVLQKLYDEATEDEDTTAINICLDIWDKLLNSQVLSASNASEKIGGGLLN